MNHLQQPGKAYTGFLEDVFFLTFSGFPCSGTETVMEIWEDHQGCLLRICAGHEKNSSDILSFFNFNFTFTIIIS